MSSSRRHSANVVSYYIYVFSLLFSNHSKIFFVDTQSSSWCYSTVFLLRTLRSFLFPFHTHTHFAYFFQFSIFFLSNVLIFRESNFSSLWVWVWFFGYGLVCPKPFQCVCEGGRPEAIPLIHTVRFIDTVTILKRFTLFIVRLTCYLIGTSK